MAKFTEYQIRYKSPSGKLAKVRMLAESKGKALSAFHALNRKSTILSIVVYNQSGRAKNGL